VSIEQVLDDTHEVARSGVWAFYLLSEWYSKDVAQ